MDVHHFTSLEYVVKPECRQTLLLKNVFDWCPVLVFFSVRSSFSVLFLYWSNGYEYYNKLFFIITYGYLRVWIFFVDILENNINYILRYTTIILSSSMFLSNYWVFIFQSLSFECNYNLVFHVWEPVTKSFNAFLIPNVPLGNLNSQKNNMVRVLRKTNNG